MYTYCIFCETGKGAVAAKAAGDFFACRAISPRQIQHTWSKEGGPQEIERDLLPGYIFLYSENPLNFSRLYAIRWGGVLYALSGSAGEYQLAGQDEAFALMLLTKDGVLGKTKVYEEGQRLHIQEGVFAGLDAVILKVERRLKRMQIEIPFSGRKVKTWVEYEVIQSMTDG